MKNPKNINIGATHFLVQVGATNEAAAVRGVEEAAAGDVGVDATFGTIDLLPVRVHIEFSSAARWLIACHLTREYCLLRHSNRRIALAAA